MVVALFLLGALLAIRRRGTREMVLFFVVLICFYSFAAPGVTFPWYGIPPSTLFFPILMLGCWRACNLIAGRFPFLAWGGLQPVWGGACFVLLLALIPGLAVRARNLKSYNQVQDNTVKAIGLLLAHETPKESTIMLEALGYIGYFSDRYAYDLGGLVSPSITRLRREFPLDWYTRAIFVYSPDYLVLRDFEIQQNVAFIGGKKLFQSDQQRADFFSRYQEMRIFRGGIVNGNRFPAFLLFRRTNGVQATVAP